MGWRDLARTKNAPEQNKLFNIEDSQCISIRIRIVIIPEAAVTKDQSLSLSKVRTRIGTPKRPTDNFIYQVWMELRT